MAKVKFGKGAHNKIKTSMGEGFFKTIMKDASKVAEGPIGKTFDKHTGLMSFAKGFTKEGSKYKGSALSRASQQAGYITKNAAGELTNVDYGKIAKGYVAASAGARIATGGGLYKDAKGNTNLIGIPFI